VRSRIIIALFVAASLLASLAGPPHAALAKKGAPGPSPSPSPSGSPTPTPEERIATLTQTVKDNPNDREAREELGVLLVQTGKLTEGRDQLENAIRLGAEDAEAWFFIGVADRELGDQVDAVTAFERAERDDPANVAVLGSLADAYLSVNRLDDAQRIANRAIQLHPKDAFGYAALGTVLLDKGKLDEGRKALQQALDVDPKDTRSHLLLGRSYMAGKNPAADLAIAQFDAVLLLDAKNVDALHAKAEALAMKNDIGGSVALLQQIVKLQPDRVEPEDDIAELYVSKKMVDPARQAFAQAIKDHPKAAEPYILQAEYDSNEHDYQKASQEYDQALALAPNDPRLNFEYARLLVAMKQYPKAEEKFNKALSLNPNNPDVLMSLGEVYAVEKKWAQARETYQRAFELTHAYTPLFNLGLSYLNLKDYRKAREAFEALAVHQSKAHPDAQLWYALAETDRLMGDKRNAIAAYRNFLAIVPKGPIADKARAYIRQLGT
jgi:tetratricopeptide (TPR) repeat protein